MPGHISSTGSHVAAHPPCAKQLHPFMLHMAHLFLNDVWQLYSNGIILLWKVMIACMCECVRFANTIIRRLTCILDSFLKHMGAGVQDHSVHTDLTCSTKVNGLFHFGSKRHNKSKMIFNWIAYHRLLKSWRGQPLKKNEHSDIIYSLSFCTKAVWLFSVEYKSPYNGCQSGPTGFLYMKKSIKAFFKISSFVFHRKMSLRFGMTIPFI